MIDPKELRIGNLLHWEADHMCADICKVTAISDYDFEVEGLNGCCPLEEEYADIEYIPLTPEWLERMGFEINGDVDFGNDTWKCKGFPFHVSIGDEGNGIDVFYLDDNDEIYISGHDYVHQLQNLFFALTGEEIKIKGYDT